MRKSVNVIHHIIKEEKFKIISRTQKYIEREQARTSRKMGAQEARSWARMRTDTIPYQPHSPEECTEPANILPVEESKK